MFPADFPQEIFELIILQSENIYISIFLQNEHTFKKLYSPEYEKEILNTLIESDSIKQLYWLHKMGLIPSIEILKRCVMVASSDFLDRIIKVIPFPKSCEEIDLLFQASIGSCKLDIIKFILEHGSIHGYEPKIIKDIRTLRYCQTVMNGLVEILEPDLIFTKDATVVALESNNTDFLQKANRLFDVRHAFSNRDMIVAAHRGAIDSLKWYHTNCPCRVTNYSHCMLDESVYKAASMAHREEIVQWLRNETNCLMFRMGYPLLGWMNSFGYGDLPSGTRGFTWFQR